MLQQDELEQSVQYDNQEIEWLANNMAALATLFKEMQTLVIEQGTIVDRIDFNLE